MVSGHVALISPFVSPKAETSRYKSLEVTSYYVPPSTHRTQNTFLPEPKYSGALSPGRGGRKGRAIPQTPDGLGHSEVAGR